MRITRENVQELIEIVDTLADELSALKEAAEAWDSLQDEERNAETAEDIRTAREELEEMLNSTDVSSLCQLVHGKHKGVKTA